MGVWFKSNASNAPFVIIAEHWFAAKNSAFVPETGGSFPYWTWEQYDEVGTTLKSRAWTGPSYAGGLLYASDDGGPPRPGDYWLQTDTGQLMYYNGTNWVTANHGEHATEYPPSEFAGSGAVSVYQRIISSPVVWQFRFPVPRLAVPIEVRITKTSYSTHDDIPKWYSDVTWESAVAHIARQFRYPNLAIAQINAQASGNFSSIPDFSGIYYGRIVKVPSNYDTTNKTYAGTWDGIWRMDWTDNPAFIVKDLVENTTYGMGTFYHVSINDWDVYDAGQWCDSRAADGNPRFTFNGLIAEPRIGKEAIDYVCGIFSGRFVDDGNGYARILIDRSDTPAVQLFTKENVELGAFNYSFSDPTTRYNDLTIAFTNPDLDWQTDRRRLYWQTAMDDFGRVPYQFVAVGCTHVYEAYLRGRYVIVTSQTETLIVQFKTSRNGLNLNPYDIVLIADELIYGKPPNAEDLSGYFIQTTGNFTPLLAANTNQPLFISEYDLPEAATVYDKLKTGRIVLGQNSALGYTGGVITTKSSLTATDAYTVLLRDPIYLEAGLAYFVTFQTLTGTAEYRVDPSWAGSIKYDLRVTTPITQQLPEKAVFSLRVEGLSDIPKPFRVLTIAPTDSDDVVEVTAVEVNRKKWEYVDGFGAAINIKSSAIYFVIDRSQSLNSTQFSEEKQAVLNALNLLEAYVQLYPGKRIDIGVVFEAAGISFMERKNVTTANINELRAFINAAGQISGGSYHGAFTQVKVFFDLTINVPFEARSVIVIGDFDHGRRIGRCCRWASR